MSAGNKQIAISFLEQVISGDVRAAFRIHASEDFEHHDPKLREGGQALADALHADQVLYPARTFFIERALQEDDLVAVHSRMQPAPTGPEEAHVHIFRFAHDRICEWWHISERVPDEVLNSNGAF
jgi:predicted SnoaL-like aldol condensation-catalyzing enzyme